MYARNLNIRRRPTISNSIPRIVSRPARPRAMPGSNNLSAFGIPIRIIRRALRPLTAPSPGKADPISSFPWTATASGHALLAAGGRGVCGRGDLAMTTAAHIHIPTPLRSYTAGALPVRVGSWGRRPALAFMAPCSLRQVGNSTPSSPCFPIEASAIFQPACGAEWNRAEMDQR